LIREMGGGGLCYFVFIPPKMKCTTYIRWDLTTYEEVAHVMSVTVRMAASVFPLTTFKVHCLYALCTPLNTCGRFLRRWVGTGQWAPGTALMRSC
jgi:hypothetical protein